jgi:hypothetical protein
MSAHIARAHAITIPANAQYDGWSTGSALFKISTEHGEINIEAGRCNSLWCRGTPEAIIGFGMIEPDWLPGSPGRCATSQTVYFTEAGPVLPTGRHRTGKRPKAPRIIVRAWGYVQRTVEVQIPISGMQREAVAALKEAAEAAEERKSEVMPMQPIPTRPTYRVDGNVIYLAPRNEWRAEPCAA